MSLGFDSQSLMVRQMHVGVTGRLLQQVQTENDIPTVTYGAKVSAANYAGFCRVLRPEKANFRMSGTFPTIPLMYP